MHAALCTLLTASLLLPALSPASAQAPAKAGESQAAILSVPAPPRFNSHQVNPDSSLTLRLYAPDAKAVTASFDGPGGPLTMTRDEHGLWSVTTQPLKPEIYGYAFNVDGVSIMDPVNHDARPNLVFFGSNVLVPGPTPEPWELQSIPHGVTSYHQYTTKIARHLPQDQEPYVVYTPAGYDPHKAGGYPVLYLLHGWSDPVRGWDETGHAADIMDSLIAGGKAVPMIVVMPQGYGDFDFVTHGFGVWQDQAKVDSNRELYTDMLLTEIMPAVTREYNTAKGREHTAIAGLSMGGLESLTIGLNHPERFAYVGGFSAAIQQEGFDQLMAGALHGPRPALLWVACGADEQLLKPNTDFVAWAQAKGLAPVRIVTPGRHEWPVWRDNLIHFAPSLFRSPAAH